MEVRIISYSQTPEDLIVGDNIQELIAYCARVSNPDNQMNDETSEILKKPALRFLATASSQPPPGAIAACAVSHHC